MIIDELKAASLKVMVSYQADLDIDVKGIEKRQGVPFLHFTRATGTYIEFLIPYEMLPKRGELVQHLFSAVGRDQLVKDIGDMSKYYLESHNAGVCKLVQYFDGDKLRKTSLKKAAEIGAAHAAKLRREIGKEIRR